MNVFIYLALWIVAMIAMIVPLTRALDQVRLAEAYNEAQYERMYDLNLTTRNAGTSETHR